jgi:hypothetical protein
LPGQLCSSAIKALCARAPDWSIFQSLSATLSLPLHPQDRLCAIAFPTYLFLRARRAAFVFPSTHVRKILPLASAHNRAVRARGKLYARLMICTCAPTAHPQNIFFPARARRSHHPHARDWSIFQSLSATLGLHLHIPGRTLHHHVPKHICACAPARARARDLNHWLGAREPGNSMEAFKCALEFPITALAPAPANAKCVHN